jgi:hypothetical protein
MSAVRTGLQRIARRAPSPRLGREPLSRPRLFPHRRIRILDDRPQAPGDPNIHLTSK